MPIYLAFRGNRFLANRTAMMSKDILKVRGITKSFGANEVLKSTTFDILENELLCLLGPSGSGKSTILSIIAGVEKQSSGELLFEDQLLSDEHRFQRDFGVVFQGLHLFPHLSVKENIVFSLKTRRFKKSKKFIEERLLFLIDLFQLQGLESRFPSELSGGEKQRVAIARAIAFEPRILLLDEPFSALDAMLKENLIFELKKLQSKLNLSILFITHDQSEAAALADRLIILNHGEILQIGNFNNIYKNPVNQFVQRFIGHNNYLEGVITQIQLDFCQVQISSSETLKIAVNGIHEVNEKVDILIRPELIRLHNDAPVEGVNVLNCKVLSSIRGDGIFKIFVELFEEFNWFFYHISEIATNSNIKISFKPESLTLYPKTY